MRLHICQLCGGLDAQFYRHHLVTNVTDSDPTYRASPLDSISVKNLPITHTISTRDLGNIILIYRMFKSQHIDIVHGHGAKGGLYARICGKLTGAKVVYTPHGGISHERRHGWTSTIQNKVEKFLRPSTDMYVFESKYAKAQFSKIIGPVSEMSFVNYNGIQPRASDQELVPTPVQTPIVIGAFGRLEYAKGFDLLVRAIKILTEEYFVPITCKIYGEGKDHYILQKLIQKLNLGDQVLLMGHALQVMDEMASCDIIIQPSRFDSMPYVPLEAMQLGKPLVVTRVGGLPELVTDDLDGLLAKPEPRDIADKLRRLCSDSDLRQHLTTNAFFKLRSRFSSTTMLRNIDSIYRSLIDEKSNSS